MSPHQQEHGYEELREVVINVMLDANANGVDRFEKLLEKTALEFCKPDWPGHGQQHFSYGAAPYCTRTTLNSSLKLSGTCSGKGS